MASVDCSLEGEPEPPCAGLSAELAADRGDGLPSAEALGLTVDDAVGLRALTGDRHNTAVPKTAIASAPAAIAAYVRRGDFLRLTPPTKSASASLNWRID